MQSAEEIHQHHCAYTQYLSRGNIFPIHQEWAKEIIRARNKNTRIFGEDIGALATEQRIQKIINNTPTTIFINGKTNTTYAYEWHTNNEQYVIQLTENSHTNRSMDTTISISHWIDAIKYTYSDKGIIQLPHKINQHTFHINIQHHLYSYASINDVEHIMRHLATPPQPALYDALKKIYDKHPTLETRNHIAQYLPYQHQLNPHQQTHKHIAPSIFPARGTIMPIDQEINGNISPLSQHQTIQLYREIDHIAQTYRANNTELLHHAPHSTECTSAT